MNTKSLLMFGGFILLLMTASVDPFNQYEMIFFYGRVLGLAAHLIYLCWGCSLTRVLQLIAFIESRFVNSIFFV